MPGQINLSRFPFVKQNGDFCLPASIENVLRYHGKNVDQFKIASLWIEAGNRFRDINIPDIAQLLQSIYGSDLEFEVGARSGQPIQHHNKQELITYIENSIDHNNPIILVKGNFAGGQQIGAHMLVAIGYDDNSLFIFDSANSCVFPICICYIPKTFLLSHRFLSQNLQTLLIRIP